MDAPQGADLKREAKLALKRKRYLEQLERTGKKSRVRYQEEHFHLVYFYPKADVMVPDYENQHTTQKHAFRAIKDIADKAEPNVEYYEDGSVGFETAIHGRTGLHWLVVSVGSCDRSYCSRRKSNASIIVPRR